MSLLAIETLAADALDELSAAERSSANPRIRAFASANPPVRLTQQEIFNVLGYTNERVRQIFLNSGIDSRTFYADPENFNRFETPDELNQRYLEGAMSTGRRAIEACLESAGLTPRDVDLLVVCTCTGYVCPDVGSRLIGQMGFRADVERAPILGLGCAGAVPALQRASDFARAHPGRLALMLAVEICSANYFMDHTLETAVGNAICADGAAACLVSAGDEAHCGRDFGVNCGAGFRLDRRFPEILDFESFLVPEELDKVGLEQRQGKLRIILAMEVRHLAGPMIERACDALLSRHDLLRSDIRFWVAHPGGRKVIDEVQKHMALTDEQLRFSRSVLRNYGNMSSPTVLYVLDEVARTGNPEPGDWGVLVALGPGMAAEAALLRW